MKGRLPYLRAWALYDGGISAFNTLITTFIFAVYFSKAIAIDETSGAALWGGMMSLAGLAILILSPIAGSIAGRAPRFALRLLTLISIVFTAGLFFAAPGSPALPVLATVFIATITFELTFIIYSAYLANLVPEQKLQRWSGYGWATGYFGSIIVLLIALLIFVQTETPLFGLIPNVDSLGVRATCLLAALWMLIFCAPLLLARTPKKLKDVESSASWRAIINAWRACAEIPGLLRFAIASALYRDGLNTIFAFGGIYAGIVHGMDFADIILFGIGLNVSAGLGATVFARLDSRLTSAQAVKASLFALLITGIAVLLAPSVPWFWATALSLSFFFGPAQAAGRARLLELSGRSHAAPALALYTVTGRVANFIGPALYGGAVALTSLQQAGMAMPLLLFIGAIWLMRKS